MKRLTYRVNIGVPEDVILVDYKSVEECQEWKSVLERLAYYEDLEEQGRMLIVPDIPKNKTLYWIWENEIIPVTYKRITSCVVADDGRPHIMCEMVTKKDRTFSETRRRKQVEHTFKKGEKRYFYADNLGKTVFFTKAESQGSIEEKGKGGMRVSNISNAKRALNYYMRKAWEAGGLSWDSDNEAEVNAIVENIVDGIKEELKEEKLKEVDENER